MRICFFAGTLSLGGIGKLTLNLTKEFINRGIEVDLFLLKSEGEYKDLIPEGARLFVAEGNNLIRTLKFIQYLRKEKPDVSISARQRQDLGNIVACLFTNTRPIISVHTNVTSENQWLSKRNVFTDFLTTILYKFPDKFIAVSKGVAEDLKFRTGVNDGKIKTIYNPVYNDNVIGQNVSINVEVEKLINEKKQYLITAARFTVQKDLFTLIRSFSIVRKKMNLYLVILGDGPQRDEIEELIDELNLSRYVIFTGFVDNPENYINYACLYVMSSKWEGFGNVLVEALGVGTPVVSTDCPSGPSEILENGKYGELVPVENPEMMADAIIKTIKNPPPANKLIDRAKEFSVSSIADEYLKFIEQK